MKYLGINYDVGVTPLGPDSPSRPNFDLEVVRNEIGIIRAELNCNAIRITGRDLHRLLAASEIALGLGLSVWFSPALHDATPRQTLDYFARAAEAAEQLRQKSGDVVFLAGWELTFFMSGLVLGATALERMQTFMKPQTLLWNTLVKGPFNWRLNRFLRRAAAVVRTRFHGPLTYAAGVWEGVDWTPFDFVAVDCYRDASNKANFAGALDKFFAFGKPVVFTEFGCCTYRGAGDRGAGWPIVDWKATPPRLNGP